MIENYGDIDDNHIVWNSNTITNHNVFDNSGADFHNYCNAALDNLQRFDNSGGGEARNFEDAVYVGPVWVGAAHIDMGYCWREAQSAAAGGTGGL